MNNLIIAGAGTGKTTYIINRALGITEKRILITTYTEANGLEIKKKFYEINGCIPANVTIQTWYSFLLEHGVKPYQGFLWEEKVTGILLVNEGSGVKYISHGKKFYWPESNTREYYFSKDGNLYTDKLAKFVYRCNELSCGAVLKRLSFIYPHIFIDEVQDMAGYDLELIKLLLGATSNVFLVGDPRQVTYHTHDERKYKKYKNGQVELFIRNECKKLQCCIDTNTLSCSHRCVKDICDFANQLYPAYSPCSSDASYNIEHQGVYLVREKDIDEYLERFGPTQLRDTRRKRINDKFPAINMGQSKGLTLERVLIYPTKAMQEWLTNHEVDLKFETRAKFYVSLTRARYSSAIVYNYADDEEIDGAQKYK